MALLLDDTIAAISTPIGAGGIGIVRMSGPGSASIVHAIFRPRLRDPVSNPRCLCYGWVIEPITGEKVDEVLVAYMPAPYTYTRQDVVEINAHGGPLVLRMILHLCISEGARLAGPGEMTLRAFVNGRIDLTQAEAVQDIVSARTEASVRQAMAQLEGRLGRCLRWLRRRLLECLAYVEASLDFEDDEVPPRDISADLIAVEEELEALLESARSGIIRREGLRAAIVGRPNVGKSSLMNALLRTERAIVTPIPGTTRDTLEETANVGGLPVVFVDTAGLGRETADIVERIGIERAKQALASADLVLFVLDASSEVGREDEEIAAMLVDGPPVIVVWNKVDLPVVPQESPLPDRPQVQISALTGQGLADLEMTIVNTALGESAGSADVTLTSERHEVAVRRALEATRLARQGATARAPLDMLAVDIRAAADALGEVTGETATEELLTIIFSTFCVGK